MTRKRTELSVAPGTVVRHLDDGETERYLTDWLQTFGANRHGVNAKAHLWHIFSAARYPAVAGEPALAEYANQVAPVYVVISNDRDQAFETDLRPERSSLSDFLVFPGNLAWTMAFTHEDGWLGPYFAKHKDYAVLQGDNAKQLAKVQQKAEARAKGWS